MADGVTQKVIIFWIVGIVLSVLCLIAQILFYILVPSSRKLDLKILTQITVAIIVNATIEYLEVFGAYDGWALLLIIGAYVHNDCALTFWKFVFSKNLYDKVIQVFVTKKMSFVCISGVISLVSIPIGIVCSILYYNEDRVIFLGFIKTYLVVRLIVHLVNLLLFCRIFYVAIRRKVTSNCRGILRICATLFVLVTISSVQMLVTYLAFYIEVWNMMIVCFVINSYQALAVMAIFVLLVHGSSDQPITKIILQRLNSGGSITPFSA